MSSNADVLGLTGSRVNVGLSTIIGVTVIANQVATVIRFVGGSSCEIGGASLTWGSGFLWDTTKDISLTDFRGTIYFAATGATAQITILKGVTSGFSVG